MSRTAPPKPMACLTIGYQHLLLPADKAMAVVSNLQHAVNVDLNYDSRRERYEVQAEPLRVSMAMVPAGSIDMPGGAEASQPVAPRVRRIAP